MHLIKKNIHLFVCLFLVIGTFLVYWQVHTFDFVNYDDTDYVQQNPSVQDGFTLDSIVWAFTTVHASNWHPVTWLSHMMDCQLFGLDAGSHHLINLFFHIANTLLLFSIFRKMTGCLWQSAVVATLFALHPMHVESVAWISERKDVLSTFFGFLTIQAYIRYVNRPGVFIYCLVLMFLALGLMSKPMLVTLPFVLLLFDFWPLKRFGDPESFRFFRLNKKHLVLIWEKVPFFILVFLSSIITFLAQKHGGAVQSLENIAFYERLANALVSYISYLIKLVLPVNLSFMYPYTGIAPVWMLAGAVFIITVTTIAAFLAARRYPYVLVGWLFYLGTLVPVIGLVQVGMQSMADRYTYVPFIGIFIIAAWLVFDITNKSKLRDLWLSGLIAIFLPVMVIFSWQQVGVWKNSITLFEHAINATSGNFTAHYNLANVLARQGRTEEAVSHYLGALKINPDDADAHNNLANTRLNAGDTKEAITHYLEALKIKPDYEGTHFNLGIAFDKLGQTEDAIRHYLNTLKTNPHLAQAHYKLGNANHKLRNFKKAEKHYSLAVQINPELERAYYNLGVTRFQQGDADGAVAAFKKALKINPDFEAAKKSLRKAISSQQHH